MSMGSSGDSSPFIDQISYGNREAFGMLEFLASGKGIIGQICMEALQLLLFRTF